MSPGHGTGSVSTPRIVVAGAQGFLGRRLCARAHELGARVLGLGRRPPGADACGRYQQVDLRDTSALEATLTEFHPTVIVHAAGAPHHASPARLQDDNVVGTARLFETNRRLGRPARVVLVSSAAVYGDPGSRPWAEHLLPAPLTAYGRSKAAAEEVAAAARDGCEVVIARVFNLCGPGQDEHHVCGALVRRVVALRRGETDVLAMGPGHPRRDFLDVRDAADALLQVALASAPAPVVNIGSGEGTAVARVAAILLELAGLAGCKVVETLGAGAGVAHSVADVHVLRGLGWRPPRGLRDSLADHFREELSVGR